MESVLRRHCLNGLWQAAACWVFSSLKLPAVPQTPRLHEYLPQFEDVAEAAGVNARTVIGGHKTKDFLLTTTGGGVALIDYDNDGWLDIFLVNGWGLEPFAKGEEPTSHLYHNNRD